MSDVSRRNVAKGLAWSVPVIVVGAPAPAVAASTSIPCANKNSPAVASHTYGYCSTGQAFTGIYTTCSTVVPAGITFTVTWCNVGRKSVVVSAPSYTSQVRRTSGSNRITLCPGECASWKFVTLRTMTVGQEISVPVDTSTPAKITSTVTVKTLPAGYVNTDPSKGVSTDTHVYA